jgi:DNA-directed RNA polymerase subunit RPC12/RpoP
MNAEYYYVCQMCKTEIDVLTHNYIPDYCPNCASEFLKPVFNPVKN